MTQAPRPLLASRLGPWLLAVVLFATSMVVARSFAAGPYTAGPCPGLGKSAGPGATPNLRPPGRYAGPALEGVFVSCAPACDLIRVREGEGLRLTHTDRLVDESGPSSRPTAPVHHALR